MFHTTRPAVVSAGALATAAGLQARKVGQGADFDPGDLGAAHRAFPYRGSNDHLRRIRDMRTFYRVDV